MLPHHSSCFMARRVPGAGLSPSRAPAVSLGGGVAPSRCDPSHHCAAVFRIVSVLCTPAQQTHLFFSAAIHIFVYHLLHLQQGRRANIDLHHPAAVTQSFCRVSVEGIHCFSPVWKHPHGTQGRDCGRSFGQGS